MVSCKCEQTPASSAKSVLLAKKDNNEDHHVQKPSADCITYRFIEYLDERSDGGGRSHGVDVTNAEADDNEEDEAGYGANVDRPDDCPRSFAQGVVNFFGHAECAL